MVVTKSAVPVSTTPVAEGQVITYTLTFSNAAGQAPATVNHTDNLSRVLDDATVTTQPVASPGLTVSPIAGWNVHHHGHGGGGCDVDGDVRGDGEHAGHG